MFEGSQWLGLLGAMVVAIVGASVISVIMHRGNEMFLLFVFITAAIKGLTYFLTSRIAIALTHHAAWDFAVATVLGFGAQGNGSTNTTFFLVHLGDTIQPSQGGVSFSVLLVLIVVEIVGLFIILGWIRLRYGKVKLHEGFVESNRYSLENG